MIEIDKLEITKLLKEEKNLTLVEEKQKMGRFGQIIFAKDSIKECTIKIIPLNKKDGSICENKLSEAKQYAHNLSQCYHQNIAKYLDQFQIGNYYFVLMERYVMTLQDWIEENKQQNQIIDRNQFIRISLEILDAVQYLNSKTLNVRDISIKNILLTQDFHVKVCDIGQLQDIDSSLQDQYNKKVLNDDIYYLPKELFYKCKQKQSEQLKYTQQDDSFAVGMVFYILAGAHLLQVKGQIDRKETYECQQKVDYDINIIILKMLLENKKWRLTIQQSVDSFQSLIQNEKKAQVEIQHKQLEQDKGKYQNFNNLLQSGIINCNQKLYKKSLEDFKNAIKINPNYDDILFYMDFIYDKEAEYDESYQFFEDYASQHPESVAAHLLSQMYSEDKEVQLKHLERVIEIYPQFFNAYFEKGVTQITDNQPEAIIYFNKAIELNPYYIDAYVNLGYCLSHQNQLEEGISCYKKIIEINPEYPDSYFNIGYSYQVKKIAYKSIKFFKLAINKSRTIDSTYSNIGKSYLQIEYFEKAIQNFQRAYKQPPHKQQMRILLENTKSQI